MYRSSEQVNWFGSISLMIDKKRLMADLIFRVSHIWRSTIAPDVGYLEPQPEPHSLGAARLAPANTARNGQAGRPEKLSVPHPFAFFLGEWVGSHEPQSASFIKNAGSRPALPHRRQHGIGKLAGSGGAAHVAREGLAPGVDRLQRALHLLRRGLLIQVAQHQNSRLQ